MRVRVVCRRVMLDNVVSLGCGKVVCDKVVCVCVYHLHRCKTSFYCRGPPGSQGVGGQRRHPLGTCENVPAL